MTIRTGRVHLEVAAEIAAFYQLWQSPCQRSLNLALVLPYLRRNPLHAKLLVDLRLVCTQQFARVCQSELVFIQTTPLLASQLAQTHVVSLAPGKVLQRSAPSLWLQHAQVNLQPLASANGRLGGPGEHNLGTLGDL